MTEDNALEIPSRILDAIVAHCRAEAPREACGILSGRAAPRVETIHSLRNEMASETRYNADPRDLVDAVVAMREKGEEMLAIYHSHPASPPIPSHVDLRLNGYGPLPQMIVSLAGPTPVLRVWRLAETTFTPLEWREVVEPESSSS